MGGMEFEKELFKRKRDEDESGPGWVKDPRLANMVAMAIEGGKDNIRSVRLRKRMGIDISKWKEDSINVGELIERIDITTGRMKENTSINKRTEKDVATATSSWDWKPWKANTRRKPGKYLSSYSEN